MSEHRICGTPPGQAQSRREKASTPADALDTFFAQSEPCHIRCLPPFRATTSIPVRLGTNFGQKSFPWSKFHWNPPKGRDLSDRYRGLDTILAFTRV